MATNSSILAWVNPMDGGIWCPTGHRVAKSQTQLKQLSMHAGNVLSCPVMLDSL